MIIDNNQAGARRAIVRHQDTVLVQVKTVIGFASAERKIDLKDMKVSIDGLHENAKAAWLVKILPEKLMSQLTKLRSEMYGLEKKYCVNCPTGNYTTRKRAVEMSTELDDFRKKFDRVANSVDEQDYENLCELAIAEEVVNAQKIINEGRSEEEIVKLSDSEVARISTALGERQLTYERWKSSLKFEDFVQVIQLAEDAFDANLFQQQMRGTVALKETVMAECIRELCKTAYEIKCRTEKLIHEKSMDGAVVSVKTVKRFLSLAQKVDDLAFVHPLLEKVADTLVGFIDDYGHEPIALRGRALKMFHVLIEGLSDQVRVTSCLETGRPLFVESVYGSVQSNCSQETLTDHSQGTFVLESGLETEAPSVEEFDTHESITSESQAPRINIVM